MDDNGPGIYFTQRYTAAEGGSSLQQRVRLTPHHIGGELGNSRLHYLSETCGHCGARYFPGEGVMKGRRRDGDLREEYHRCCGAHHSIVLPDTPEPAAELKALMDPRYPGFDQQGAAVWKAQPANSSLL
jgi:hypothetical protein